MTTYSNITDAQLVAGLLAAQVGVLPTDTVYGLVCRAADPDAVSRLYQLEHRDKKPGTLVAASIDQLVELGLKRRYLTAVAQYWPGAVTVVVPTDNPGLSYLDQGVGSLAVRVVDDPKLVKLLQQIGPLVTTSANQPGESPANTISEARKYFGETIDFCVEGGDLSDRKPSTLIRIIDDTVEVLREGAVTILS